VRAVIRADGHIGDLSVKKSSGHAVLDEAAMDVIRRISPVPMNYDLGRPELVVNIPINYRLD
jgi:protein TonB